MTDPALARLAETVERGAGAPPIRVFTASFAAAGTPVASQTFVQDQQKQIEDDLWEGAKHRRHRAADQTRQDAYRKHLDGMRDGWQAITAGVAESPDQALKLAGARVWPTAQKAVLDLPMLRVPLAAVNGWWPAGGSRKELADWYGGVFFTVGQ